MAKRKDSRPTPPPRCPFCKRPLTRRELEPRPGARFDRRVSQLLDLVIAREEATS